MADIEQVQRETYILFIYIVMTRLFSISGHDGVDECVILSLLSQIGNAFVDHYYNTFDTNRQGLFNLYVCHKDHIDGYICCSLCPLKCFFKLFFISFFSLGISSPIRESSLKARE